MLKQFLLTFPALEDNDINVAAYKVNANDPRSAAQVAQTDFTVGYPKERIGAPIIVMEHDQVTSWSHAVIVPAVSPDADAPQDKMFVTLGAYFVKADNDEDAALKGLERTRELHPGWVPLKDHALMVTFNEFEECAANEEPCQLLRKQDIPADFGSAAWAELETVLTNMSDNLSALRASPASGRLDQLGAQTTRLERLLNQLIRVKAPEVETEHFSETVWYALRWPVMTIKSGLASVREASSPNETKPRVKRLQAQVSLLQEVLSKTLDDERKTRVEQPKIHFYPTKEQTPLAYV